MAAVQAPIEQNVLVPDGVTIREFSEGGGLFTYEVRAGNRVYKLEGQQQLPVVVMAGKFRLAVHTINGQPVNALEPPAIITRTIRGPCLVHKCGDCGGRRTGKYLLAAAVVGAVGAVAIFKHGPGSFGPIGQSTAAPSGGAAGSAPAAPAQWKLPRW